MHTDYAFIEQHFRLLCETGISTARNDEGALKKVNEGLQSGPSKAFEKSYCFAVLRNRSFLIYPVDNYTKDTTGLLHQLRHFTIHNDWVRRDLNEASLSWKFYLANNTVTHLNPFFLRAAFKFGRRAHFALRRKMRKPPIARLPAI